VSEVPAAPEDPFAQDPFTAELFGPAPGSDPFADGAVEGAMDGGARPGMAPLAWSGGAALDMGVEDLLRQAAEMVASARRAPLSASVLVARDDLLELLQRALDVLPDELRQARWLLRERDEFLAQRQREADALLEEVRAQAQRMVQRTEIVRYANQAAERVVEDARDEARRLRHEAEEFCDKKLAAFEIVLERTAKTVRAGRERLAAPAATASGPGAGSDAGAGSYEGHGPEDRPAPPHPGGARWSRSGRSPATSRDDGWPPAPAEAVDPLFDQDTR
jgi:hypothetical protein